MNDELLRAVAERQWRDYCARTPGTLFAGAEEPPFDVADAYAVQRAVADIRLAGGDTIAGFKVGCTGPGTTTQFGMAGPIRGFLFGSEIRSSGTTLAPDGFASLAIEGEMAVSIGESGAIVSAFPVIELHNFVFRCRRKTLAELIANNGFNAGIIMARGRSALLETMIPAWNTLGVRINGSLVAEAGLWPLPGGPAASLDWLRGDLAREGLSISPGQIVIVGTPLGLYPVHPGDRIETCLDGVSVVACSVEQPALRPSE
ncbi:hypothetical protein GXW71_09915 [Roseomonas hellenica]|uniref:Hydratase n=1 Tax=Plastoroseomonas hellenica TaxID=2687306 RepID=A0ABS5EWJ6_9PROT|nr:hypothetical protein [Plastoroseomonas hellenica]MBR0664667.1 hypothetical protein [Plastoroseomonas hellenica]